MGLSWTDGLLAGAEGVAKFSDNERTKRQARLDRIQQLKDSVSVHRAKSDYALRLQRYEDNQKAHRSLGEIDPSSAKGQLLLMRHYNPNISEGLATQLVQQNFSRKNPLLKLPDKMDEPQFNLPSLERGEVAISPISDWVFSFKNSGSKKYASSLEEYQTQGDKPIEQPPQQASALPTPSPQTGDGIEPTQTPGGTTVGAGGTMSPVGATAINPEDQAVFESLRKKTQPVKYDIRTASGVQGGVKGQFITAIDPHNPSNIITHFVGTGEAALKQLPSITRENEDGSKTLITRQLNTETGVVDSGDEFQVASADPSAPATFVKTSDLKNFMQPKTNSQSAGEFYGIFPEEERRKWSSWYEREPEGFKERLGAVYLQNKVNLFAEGAFIAADISDPKTMAEADHYVKALSYLQVLGGPDALIEAVKEEQVPISLMYGPEQDDDDNFIYIRSKLTDYINEELKGKEPKPFSFIEY